MKYRLKTASRRVEKNLADLPLEVRTRVQQELEHLSENPRSPGAQKLSGRLRGRWRVRVGQYRIVYHIDDKEMLVTVLDVGHRRDIYR